MESKACENTYFRWITRTGFLFVTEETDGLVPKRSQIGENTSWVNNADVRELQGDNHLEMRSSINSSNRLNEAFNGTLGGGNFSISQ